MSTTNDKNAFDDVNLGVEMPVEGASTGAASIESGNNNNNNNNANGVDSLHPLRDSEPNSAASSTAASRRSTFADIESDENEGMHYSVDHQGRRKSRNLREAVAHLKEEAIRR